MCHLRRQAVTDSTLNCSSVYHIYIYFFFFYRNFWIVFWALPRHCLSVSVSTCADDHVYVRTCMYVFFPLLCEWLNVCLYQSIHFLLESDQRPRLYTIAFFQFRHLTELHCLLVINNWNQWIWSLQFMAKIIPSSSWWCNFYMVVLFPVP